MVAEKSILDTIIGCSNARQLQACFLYKEYKKMSGKVNYNVRVKLLHNSKYAIILALVLYNW